MVPKWGAPQLGGSLGSQQPHERALACGDQGAAADGEERLSVCLFWHWVWAERFGQPVRPGAVACLGQGFRGWRVSSSQAKSRLLSKTVSLEHSHAPFFLRGLALLGQDSGSHAAVTKSGWLTEPEIFLLRPFAEDFADLDSPQLSRRPSLRPSRFLVTRGSVPARTHVVALTVSTVGHLSFPHRFPPVSAVRPRSEPRSAGRSASASSVKSRAGA